MGDAARTTDVEKLSTPLQFLKGVGPQRAELLVRLDLHTVRDLLFFFPREYEDVSQLCTIDELREGQPASIRGEVEEVDFRETGPGRCTLGLLLRQGQDHLRAIWFNQPFLQRRFYRGQQLLLSGVPRRKGLRWELAHPKVTVLEGHEAAPSGGILPVYPLTEGIKQYRMRVLVQGAVSGYAQFLPEVFPDWFLDRHRLWPIRVALPQIHQPQDRDSLQQARRRFVYQELLVLQLALALKKRQQAVQARAPSLPADSRIDARIRRRFPFEMTAGQNQAIAEVAADMAGQVPMNRLLQGDVGSGKTAVAVYAMLLAVAHQHQAALMCPTEVLAHQHYHTLINLLGNSQVRIGLLTGSLTPAQRTAMLDQIREGQLDLVVGTQAVLQSAVQFHRLGLVVADEQHKFGVRQRATLRGSVGDPHSLVMTATPIPRTIAMTLFGDLDVSTLRDSPPGRQPVHTYLGDDAQRESWWTFFRQKLREGRQGYVIAPLVDESEMPDVSSAEQAFETLVNGQLHEFRLDLVHGRMGTEEKKSVMASFREGRTQVLVATSVVEVGVDVPNATVMTIENGERFGLAQLHQLRGRVSRGNHPGYVCVFADASSQTSRRRLEILAATTDGFQLAEADLELRGPGELFGTRQHGVPPLMIADLLRDSALLEEARASAQALVAMDAELADPSLARLRRMVLARYGSTLELGQVG